MSKLKYTEFEKQMNSVLKHQDKALADIHFPSLDKTDATIARTEDLLRNLGYQPEALKGLTPIQQPKKGHGCSYLGRIVCRGRETRWYRL
ncbi:MAG: hypothetical protein ACLVB5_00100 [Christensenellales bacterium]